MWIPSWKTYGLWQSRACWAGLRGAVLLSPRLMQWLCSSYAGGVSSVKSLTQGRLCPAQSLKGNLRTVTVTEVLEGQKRMLRKTNIPFCFLPFQTSALWKDVFIELKFAVWFVRISSKKCNKALTWLTSRGKQQWLILALFIQHKENSKADFKVRHA